MFRAVEVSSVNAGIDLMRRVMRSGITPAATRLYDEIDTLLIGSGEGEKADKKTEFLFIAGKPIGEPIARGGPFVMNTKAEILEAVQDYNNGTFAKY